MRFTRTDAHGVVVFDFASRSGCTQQVHGPTHREGSVLDFLMKSITYLFKVKIGCSIRRSDHLHFSSVLDSTVGANFGPLYTESVRKSFASISLVRNKSNTSKEFVLGTGSSIPPMLSER